MCLGCPVSHAGGVEFWSPDKYTRMYTLTRWGLERRRGLVRWAKAGRELRVVRWTEPGVGGWDGQDGVGDPDRSA